MTILKGLARHSIGLDVVTLTQQPHNGPYQTGPFLVPPTKPSSHPDLDQPCREPHTNCSSPTSSLKIALLARSLSPTRAHSPEKSPSEQHHHCVRSLTNLVVVLNWGPSSLFATNESMCMQRHSAAPGAKAGAPRMKACLQRPLSKTHTFPGNSHAFETQPHALRAQSCMLFPPTAAMSASKQ